ncbi:MAG: ABC transporter ATP-binding protein [Actinomycetia bacterium]|nr:ABC transporter ATP-binding protein [Actinomycetes bacterium]
MTEGWAEPTPTTPEGAARPEPVDQDAGPQSAEAPPAAAGGAHRKDAPKSTAGLDVRGLGLRIGGVIALSELSFQMPVGGLYAVIGPNGAGKTSFFNCLTGYYKATSGTATWNGRSLIGVPSRKVAARGVRRTFQNLRILGNLTVAENVLTGAYVRSPRRLDQILVPIGAGRRLDRALKEEAASWIARVGLADVADKAAADLPYGARKRLEIARALIGAPELLLLDEPAAGISSVEREQFSELVLSLHADGLSILLIEHDVELVMRLAEHVLVLDYGKLLASGAPDQVRNDPEVIRAYMGEPVK